MMIGHPKPRPRPRRTHRDAGSRRLDPRRGGRIVNEPLVTAVRLSKVLLPVALDGLRAAGCAGQRSLWGSGRETMPNHPRLSTGISTGISRGILAPPVTC